MSEEEKKAIEIIKKEITKPETTPLEVYITDIKMLLNIINKQQKELNKIKALNIPIDTLVAEFERLENIEDDRDCNYISKDKIREKIKELEKCKEEELKNDDKFGTHSMKWAIADYVIETLKELFKNE